MKKPIIFILALGFLAACQSPVQKTDVRFSEPLPESEGELLYLDMKCPVCHGYQGAGDGFLADGLNPKPTDFTSVETMKSLSDTQIKKAILKGKGAGMPNYPQFTEHQISKLATYIRYLSQTSGN